MCEKPMAKTYAEALKMVETSKRTKKILTIGYQNRNNVNSMYLKQVCERGDLGEIYYAKAHAVRRRMVPTWGVFLDAEAQGGGPLIDIGTHSLDLTLWLMNNYEPVSVTGSVFKKLGGNLNCGNEWGPWDPKKYTVEDSAFGFIQMKNGATIYLEASWALNVADNYENSATLCGTKAGADMLHGGVHINSDDFDRLNMFTPNLTTSGAAFFEGRSAGKPHEIECRTFYNAVLYGSELIVKAEQALVVTQILEGIYESGKTGKQFIFDQPKAAKAGVAKATTKATAKTASATPAKRGRPKKVQ
jgi:predicted dehydrogenase